MKKRALWICLAAFILGTALMCGGMAMGGKRALTIDRNGVHPAAEERSDIPVEPFDAIEIDMTDSSFQTIQILQGTEWKLETVQPIGTVFDIAQENGKLSVRETQSEGHMEINLSGGTGSPLVRITVPQALKEIRIQARADIYFYQVEAENIDIVNEGAQVGFYQAQVEKLTGKLTDSWIRFDRCDIARSTLHSFDNTRGDGIIADELSGGVHEWYVYGSGVSAVLEGSPQDWYLDAGVKDQPEKTAQDDVEAARRLMIVCPDAAADVRFTE